MTETWIKGSWMHTFMGRQFYPLAPRVQDVSIYDIAHSLSLQCRYNGHVKQFYSVAEHCVKMSQTFADDDENALWALLHDATEAYVGDMVRPLKKYMPDFIAAEDRVMEVIAARFGLSSAIMPEPVKDVDNRILLTERNALMTPTAFAWEQDGLEPLDVRIDAWAPAQAEAAYLDRFEELYRV